MRYSFPFTTGLAAVLGDQQSGNLTLEGCHAVGSLGGGDILRTDLGDSAGEGLSLLDAVAHDHGFVQEFGIFHKDDFHLFGGPEFTGLEADGGNLQSDSLRDLKGEVTVNIGSGANSRPRLNDGRPDNRLLLRIRDRAGRSTSSLKPAR